MVNQIAQYGFPVDYVKQREQVVKDMTLDSHRAIAERYIVPDRMVYLVVGDAATQLARLRQLGLGEPILLDRQGNRVSGAD
jgi:zinc protease